MNIKVSDVRSCTGKTLRGFLSVQFPEIGLQISDVAYHKRNGRRWLQLPAKPFTRTDGSKGWNYILEFIEKSKYQKFQELTLEALDAFRSKTGRSYNDGTNKT